MLTANSTGAQSALLLSATSPIRAIRRTLQSASIARTSSSLCATSLSWIAQVTMSLWLLCSQEQQSWTLHFFLLLAINLALSLRLLSIWQQSRSWIWTRLLSFRTKLTSLLRILTHALSSNRTSKTLLKAQWLMVHLSSPSLHLWATILTAWWIICVEFLFPCVTSCLLPR